MRHLCATGQATLSRINRCFPQEFLGHRLGYLAVPRRNVRLCTQIGSQKSYSEPRPLLPRTDLQMQKVRARSGVFSRARALRSLFAALLYVMGIVGLPGLHLGFHRLDHEHHGGGLKWLRTGHHDHHVDGARDHERAHAQALPATAAFARLAQLAGGSAALLQPASASHSSPEILHGGGNLAHFSCSYLSAADDLPCLHVAPGSEPAFPGFISSALSSTPFLFGIGARAPPAELAS